MIEEFNDRKLKRWELGGTIPEKVGVCQEVTGPSKVVPRSSHLLGSMVWLTLAPCSGGTCVKPSVCLLVLC